MNFISYNDTITSQNTDFPTESPCIILDEIIFLLVLNPYPANVENMVSS